MMVKRHFQLAFAVVQRFAALVFFMGIFASQSYAQIWVEDFDTYPDATTTAPPKWTSYATDCDDAGINIGPGASQWGVWAGAFTCNDIEGAPCCAPFGGGGNDNAWTSEVIDISDYCNVIISLDVSSVGTFECSPIGPLFACQGNPNDDNGHDQIVGEYSLNGGPWTQFMYICGSGNGTYSTTGLNGNTLQIKVYASNKSNGEFYYFDNVVVNGATAPTPTFNPVGPICENATPVVLPTTSNQGITGTWNPSSINPAGQGGNTITATFTPGVGQCAMPTTMDVSITPATTPTPNPIGPFCTNDPSVNLPTNIGGINGTWSGTGVSGNVFNPMTAGAGSFSLTFTPTMGQCANSAMLPVTVNLTATPNLGTTTLCETDPAYNLTQLQDPSYPAGTWSGPGVSGTNFNPMGQSGSVTLTFTSSTNCVLPANTSITVNQATTPAITGVPASICESENSIPLPTTQGGITGTWAGSGVSGNSFDPTGLSGSVTLTFTPNAGQCANPATTNITVNQPTTPAITGVPASICENENAIALPTPQGGFAGNWSGSGVSGNSFDPTGLSGSVTLTFTPNAGQCANPATTSITVNQPTTPAITGVPASICESANSIPLPTTQGGITGNWSGSGVSGNNFDPTGLSGSVTLTFTPNAGQCANPATTNITVNQPTTPAITGVPASICENENAISLPTPQGGFAGNWSGPGVSGNSFDPTGLSGSVILTFTPNAGQCANQATTSITVNQPITPSITGVPASICENANPINLPTTQSGVTGTWSGFGVTGNSFDPAGLNGSVTLTFTPNAGQCANPATTSITVNQPGMPMLGSATMCQNSGLYDLNLLADPNFPSGTWVGSGVSGTNFNPLGQSGSVALTFVPTGTCAMPGSTNIIVNPSLNFSGVMEECDLLTQTYTVSFDITGGTAPFTINGAPIGGSNFVSPPIPSGTSYVFEIDDATGCGPVLVAGSQNCSCATNAGSMNFANAPLVICSHHFQFSVPFNQDEVLDNDDVLQFVLHDGPDVTTSNILSTSNSAVINIPPSLVLGQTYYVSSIAGNNDGAGNVDFADPCFSFSQGIPVTFYSPTIQLGNDVTICASDCYNLPVQFTGVAPFYFEWNIYFNNILVGNSSSSNLPSNSSVEFCPSDFNITSGVVRLEVTALEDGNSCGVTLSSPIVNITVGNSVVNNLSETLCPGEAIVINGTTYNQANPSGTETLPGASASGCDSIVNVNLAFYPPANFTLAQTLCGNASLTVNGTVYNQSNPSGTEILQNASVNGCDSTVFVNLTFNPNVTSTINPTLCPDGSLTVNGTVYNAANPTGTETMPGASYLGCDSVATVNLSFFPAAVGSFSQTFCTGGSVTIGGTVFDENNPSGSVILPNASVNGCDSTVNVSLSFSSVVTSTINPTLCPNGSVTVNGTVYNAANPSGTETMPGASYLGCDSVAMVNLSFFPAAVGSFSQALCTGGSVTIGGTVFDETNPSGTVILSNASVNGCDSTVNVSLSFSSVVTSIINPTLCPNGSLTVNGTVYNAANPSGTETMPGASYLGCDSVAMVNLSFFPPAQGSFSTTLCADETVTVGGSVFSQANPNGTVTIPNGSVNGCDSTVMVSVQFFPPAQGSFSTTLCSGETVTVGGTVFSQANPSGTVTIPNGSVNGCDSTVTVSIQFFPPAQGSFSTTLCPGETVTVGGTIFSQVNPSGTVTIPNGSVNGCDSTVTVSVQFFPAASSILDDQLCTGGSITVNGTVYNEQNPSGTEILQNASVNGCDSTVVINLTFGSSVTETIDPTLCPDEVLVVNGETFSAANPTGSFTFPNGSYLGCDSILNVSLSFYPVAEGNITEILQQGESILVNGTIYNEQNPSGTEIFVGASYTGCDSTVIINLSFAGQNAVGIVEISSPLCHFGNDGVITLTEIQGGTPPYVVALNGGNSAPVVNFPIVFDGLTFGFHTLTIIDALGVITTQEVFMPDAPEITLNMDNPNTAVPLGNSVTLGASSSSQIATWAWSPSDYLSCTDCPNPVSTPENDIVYTISVTDINGCTAEGELAVFVEKLIQVYVPNAFSPNNDGINDELTVFAGPQVEIIKSFQIFSRWGELVFEVYNFEPNDLQLGWNGRFKGEELDPAVFVWYVEVVFKDGQNKLFKGGVSLIR